MRLVPETLQESQDFQRGLDPKQVLGIGTPTWETLQVGDVIECTKFTRTVAQWNDSQDSLKITGTNLYSDDRPYSDASFFRIGEYYMKLEVC